MANEKPFLLTGAAIAQIQQVVREFNNRHYKNVNNPLPQGRWQGRYPITSGGVTRVRFQIVSSDPTTLTGLAEILSWNYGFTKSQIPASILGNTVIEICDPKGCMLNEPNTDLTGRQGDAEYRQGVADSNCRTGYEPFPGVWEVTSLCCKLVSCDVVI